MPSTLQRHARTCAIDVEPLHRAHFVGHAGGVRRAHHASPAPKPELDQLGSMRVAALICQGQSQPCGTSRSSWNPRREDNSVAVDGQPQRRGALSRLERSWKTEIPGWWTFDRLIGGCAAQGEDEAWRRIASRLSPELCAAIDRLLDVGEDAHRSMLFQLKQAPPQASPPAILDYLERFERLQALGAGGVDLEMNRQWITTMMRHARHATEKREAEARRRAEQGTRLMTQALRIVLDSSMPPAERIEKMLREVAEDRLLEALTLCDEAESHDEIYVDELLARHSHLKQYLPRFLALPFRGEPGAETLSTD